MRHLAFITLVSSALALIDLLLKADAVAAGTATFHPRAWAFVAIPIIAAVVGLFLVARCRRPLLTAGWSLFVGAVAGQVASLVVWPQGAPNFFTAGPYYVNTADVFLWTGVLLTGAAVVRIVGEWSEARRKPAPPLTRWTTYEGNGHRVLGQWLPER